MQEVSKSTHNGMPCSSYSAYLQHNVLLSTCTHTHAPFYDTWSLSQPGPCNGNPRPRLLSSSSSSRYLSLSFLFSCSFFLFFLLYSCVCSMVFLLFCHGYRITASLESQAHVPFQCKISIPCCRVFSLCTKLSLCTG